MEGVAAIGLAGYTGYEAYQAYEDHQQDNAQYNLDDGTSCYLPFPPDEYGGLNINYSNGDHRYGLPNDFWNWYHRQVKMPGDQDLSKEEADELYEIWKEAGKPNADGSRTE